MLSGELDLATADELVAAVASVVERNLGVQVDLAGVEFIDAAGLRALDTCAQRAAQQHWDFFLDAVSPAVERALSLAASHRLLRWYRPRFER